MSIFNNAIYRGLSDSLSAAIDTGNGEDVAKVLSDAYDYLNNGLLSIQHRADLEADAQVAGYDY